MRLKSWTRGLLIKLGTWFFDTSESLALLLPQPIKPRARKAIAKARTQAKKALEKDSLTRVFLENLGYRTAANLVTKVVMFFLILWLTRVLTPEEFGLYSFTISTAMLFSVFGGLGVSGAMLKKVPEYLARGNKEKASSWVLGGLILLAIGGLFMFLLLFGFSPYLANYLFHKPFTRRAIKLAAGFLYLSLLAGFLGNLFAALKRNDLFFKAGIAREAVKLVAMVFLVLLGFSYVGAVYGYMLGIFTFILVSTLVLFSRDPSLFEGRPENPVTVFSYSKWFLALGITGTILSMTDTFMIPIFMPIEYTGYYKVAVSLVSTIMYLIPVGMVTMPIFSESRDKRELESRFKQIFWPVLYFTLAIAVLVAILGKPLLGILYPADYVEHAWLPLVVLAFLIPARNAFWLNAQRLIVLGKEKQQLLITSLAAGLNVILNALLIPWLGLVGAALASVLSLVVGVVVVVDVILVVKP